MSDGLNSVGVKINALFFTNCTDFRNRLDRTDLVVCIHYCNKAGVVSESFFKLVKTNVAVLMNIKVGYLKAFFFKLHQRVKNGMMLKRC